MKPVNPGTVQTMNSKRKGNQAERELLCLLRSWGVEAVRNDQRYTGGIDNPDIAAKIGPVALHMEVKRQERLSLPAALRQAKRDANGHSLPIVAHRSNRQPWLVTVELEALLEVLGLEKTGMCGPER